MNEKVTCGFHSQPDEIEQNKNYEIWVEPNWTMDGLSGAIQNKWDGYADPGTAQLHNAKCSQPKDGAGIGRSSGASRDGLSISPAQEVVARQTGHRTRETSSGYLCAWVLLARSRMLERSFA